MARDTVEVVHSPAAEGPAGPRPSSSGSTLLRLGVGLAVLIGVVARFVTVSPLWLDEALSANISSLPFDEIGVALRRDGHPPLYYWLLHGWSEVFGTGDVALRALSGVFALAALPLAWLAGRRLGGRTTAAWALVLLSLSPFAVRYASEVRMYSLVLLLVLAGAVLLPRCLDHASWLRLAGLSAVVSALLWTHYWSLYLVGSVGLLLVLTWWRRPKTRSAVRRCIGAVVVGTISFLPWVPSLLTQLEQTGTPWAVPARPTQAAALTVLDLGGGEATESALVGVLIVVLVVLGLFGRRSPGGGIELGPGPAPVAVPLAAVVALTLAGGGLAGYLSGSAFASRYAAAVVPSLLLLTARGLALLPRGWLRLGLAGPLVALCLVGLGLNATVERTQAGGLAERITRDGQAGDHVVVCPDQLGPSIERALDAAGGPDRIVPYPLAGDPRFVDWRDYTERNDRADPAAFAATVLEEAGGATIWVVWNGSYRTLEGDCEAVIQALGAMRAGTEVATAGEEFEPANLYRFE